MFFQAKPNLADGDKAKVELYFHELALVLGEQRLLGPIRTHAELLPVAVDSVPSAEVIQSQLERIGGMLQHDVSGIELLTVPQAVEKCGSGGG